MIAWLSGIVREKQPDRVVIDCHGVGYLLRVPASTVLALPAAGETAELHVSTQVREDSISLYGFVGRDQLDLFERLLSVSGVGPKMALAALSVLGPVDLAGAIAGGDPVRLATVPGIGKKTAERIVVDLRDKVLTPAASGGVRAIGAGAALADVISALVNLGYPERHAAKAATAAEGTGATGFDALLRESLSRLGRA